MKEYVIDDAQEDDMLEGMMDFEEEDVLMDTKHPLFEASVEVGKELFAARKQAEKEGAKGTPFGMQHKEPAEFRAEMERGGEAVRRATLERLKKEKGSARQGLSEYLRQIGGK